MKLSPASCACNDHVLSPASCVGNDRVQPQAASCACNDCVPYMRYGHSASAIGDLVFIFGGRNDTRGACNTLYRFDTGKVSTD